MRKRLLLLCLTLCLLLAPARAEEAPSWQSVPETLHPGRLTRLDFALPYGTLAKITVLDGAGETVLVLKESAATGRLFWDGGDLPAGSYTLRLTCGETVADTPITIGTPAPGVEVLDAMAETSGAWEACITCSARGTLRLTLEDGTEALTQSVEEGENTILWDGAVDGARVSAGEHSLMLTLVDETGVASASQAVDVAFAWPRRAHDAEDITPGEMSGVQCGHEICFWKLPMGTLDEAAVWQVLTQPVTVLDGNERHQVKIRREPDKDCQDYTGEVTCESQAVHVLERGETWTLIEAYSSSVEGSRVGVWAKPFTGYVETSLLKEKPVSQEYGVVIDKLQQRLYIYREGKLFSTLLCSTGFPRADTPFNETPAGEYITVSWVGGFWAGNLFCDMGIRVNDGILLHEVPCLINKNEETGEETRDYARCEQYLGEKASHGCIRIQKEKTPQGVSAKWLWDNLPRGKNAPAKVIIWDEIGRTLLPADDAYPLYYNPDNGRQYHSDPECLLVNQRFWPLTAFTYGELEESPYAKLKPCPGCAPEERVSGIEQLNQQNTRK